MANGSGSALGATVGAAVADGGVGATVGLGSGSPAVMSAGCIATGAVSTGGAAAIGDGTAVAGAQPNEIAAIRPRQRSSRRGEAGRGTAVAKYAAEAGTTVRGPPGRINPPDEAPAAPRVPAT